MLHGHVTIIWLAASQPFISLFYEIAWFTHSEKQPRGCSLLKLAALTSWLSFSTQEAERLHWQGQAVPPEVFLTKIYKRTALRTSNAVGLSLSATGKLDEFLPAWVLPRFVWFVPLDHSPSLQLWEECCYRHSLIYILLILPQACNAVFLPEGQCSALSAQSTLAGLHKPPKPSRCSVPYLCALKCATFCRLTLQSLHVHLIPPLGTRSSCTDRLNRDVTEEEWMVNMPCNAAVLWTLLCKVANERDHTLEYLLLLKRFN